VSENKMNQSFIWHTNAGISFFCFITIHAFDRWTDRNLVANTALHSTQCGKNYIFCYLTKSLSKSE